MDLVTCLLALYTVVVIVSLSMGMYLACCEPGGIGWRFQVALFFSILAWPITAPMFSIWILWIAITDEDDEGLQTIRDERNHS